MAIEKRKIGGKEMDWDTELGGPVVSFPPNLQPKQPHKPKLDDRAKAVKTD